MYRYLWQFVLAGIFMLQVQLALAIEDSQTSGLAIEDFSGLGTSVRVEDKVGEFIPLELVFRDERGSSVKLDRYFKQGKTVVVTLNYSDCPGLCIAQLENLVETLRKLDGRGLAENYEIVTISIDPREQPDKASRTKAKYAGLLRGTKVVEGWHFLVGNQPEITALAKSLGYYYTYDKANNRFNHPAVLYFVSSEGRLCRYLTDLGVEPEQFKLAVSEAGEGKLTRSLAETFVQFCYTYDPEKNRYSADAKKIMAVGFASFAVLMGGFLAPFWFGKSKPKDVAKVTNQSSADDNLTTNS